MYQDQNKITICINLNITLRGVYYILVFIRTKNKQLYLIFSYNQIIADKNLKTIMINIIL